jgi:hypothetical protein
MATAGLFNLLIVDDTNQDNYLVSQTILKERLLNIKKDKIKQLEDKIYDINKNIETLNKKSYTLIKNKNFNKNKEDIAELNKTLTYLKDNYNDLIKPKVNEIDTSHFLFINNQYKPFVEFSFEYLNSTINTKPLFGNTVEFTISPSGEFISDMFIYAKLSELKPFEQTDKVRYCDYLGHKIIKNIQFIINNNVIDEYTSEMYNIHYFMHVNENKKNGWLKCVGQQIPIEATLIQDPSNDNYQEKRFILNGLQTLKNSHDSVELFIPLLFWFNKDRRLALPNNVSQYGKVKVRVELETVNKLVTCIDINNDLYNEKYITPTIQEFELYTNHIYINPEIQDIFVTRLGFILVRIHKRIDVILNKNKDKILLPQLKFPLESLYLSFRPDINENGLDNLQTWYKNSILQLKYIQAPVVYDLNGTKTFGYNSIKYYEETPVVNSLELTVNNTSTYSINNVNLYDGYLPYISDKNIITSNNNIYYLPFSFYESDYQPCGYLNLSKAREIYLEYNSNYIEDYKPIRLYAYAKTINFLLITKNSANLKYIT